MILIGRDKKTIQLLKDMPDFMTMKSVTLDKNGNMTSIEFRTPEEFQAMIKINPGYLHQTVINLSPETTEDRIR